MRYLPVLHQPIDPHRTSEIEYYGWSIDPIFETTEQQRTFLTIESDVLAIASLASKYNNLLNLDQDQIAEIHRETSPNSLYPLGEFLIRKYNLTGLAHARIDLDTQESKLCITGDRQYFVTTTNLPGFEEIYLAEHSKKVTSSDRPGHRWQLQPLKKITSLAIRWNDNIPPFIEPKLDDPTVIRIAKAKDQFKG